jgi:hypothetical protein
MNMKRVLDLTVASAILSLATGTSAFAQALPPSLTIPNLSRDNTDLVIGLNPAVKSTARIVDGTAYRNIATDVPLGPGSALSSFKIVYRNGDHALRNLAVRRMEDGLARVQIADARSGDDPLDAHATWWTIPGATGGEVSGDFATNAAINFDIPAGPAWHYLVLGGFEINVPGFDTLNTHEQRIQRVSISAQQAVSEARVNRPPKITVAFETQDAGKPINVKVHYAWVPLRYLKTINGSPYYVEQRSNANSTSRPGAADRTIATMRGPAPNSDQTLLTGFDLRFTNEPHNLLAFGVHLNGQNGQATPGNEAISWQDNNRDDPISWTVSYFTLK